VSPEGRSAYLEDGVPEWVLRCRDDQGVAHEQVTLVLVLSTGHRCTTQMISTDEKHGTDRGGVYRVLVSFGCSVHQKGNRGYLGVLVRLRAHGYAETLVVVSE
jgi:hypothetical protein